MQADREMRAWCHGALSCLGCVWWSEGMLWYVSTEVQASNMAEYAPKPSPPSQLCWVSEKNTRTSTQDPRCTAVTPQTWLKAQLMHTTSSLRSLAHVLSTMLLIQSSASWWWHYSLSSKMGVKLIPTSVLQWWDAEAQKGEADQGHTAS